MTRARLFGLLCAPTLPLGAVATAATAGAVATAANAGTFGIQASTVTGNATVSFVTVTGAAAGGASLSPGFTLTRGEGNSGF
jgi:hypothetical protein